MDRDELIRLMVETAHQGGQPPTRVFTPVPVRPHDYPPELPFIPDVYVTITTIDDTVGLNWFMVKDPDALLRQLAELSESEGWARREAAAPPEVRFHSLSAHYSRGGAERGITAITSGMLRMVTMTQRKG